MTASVVFDPDAGFTFAEVHRVVVDPVTLGAFFVAMHVLEGGALWCDGGRLAFEPAVPLEGAPELRAAILGVLGWAAPADTRRAPRGRA